MTEAGARSAEARDLLSRGKADIEARAYESAIAALNRGLEVQPGDVEILFHRGLARLRSDDVAGALEDYTLLLERQPDHSAGRYNRAFCLRRTDKFAESEAEFSRFLQGQPNDWEALLQRGIVRLALNQPDGARADLDRAAGLQPKHADILFQRGRALMALGLWAEAIPDFEASLKLNPDYTNVYYNRAWCRGKLGDHAGSVEDYTRYLGFYPKDVDAHLYRGNRRFDLCDLRGTLADYEKALELDPKLEKDLRTWIDLARKIEKLERDGPNDQFVAECVERAAAKRGAAENATALLWLERALEVDPNAVAALQGRALTYVNLGRHADAIRDGSRAIELKPGDPALWDERGRARRMSGDHAGAIADFSRALELKPDYAFALSGRGYAYILQENYPPALKDYQRCVDLNPNSGIDVWHNLGWLRRKLGQPAEAVAAHTRAIELNAADADSWCQRGYAKRETGDKDGARTDLRKAIELKPELKEALEKYLADMDAAAPPPKPAPAPVRAAAPKERPAVWEDLKRHTVSYLIACAVVGLLGFFRVPILGDIPARAMDMPYKVAWMVSHWNDAQAFPTGSNVCTEPFCVRTDTSKEHVGGRSGYTSQVHYYYCPDHSPTFLSVGGKFDGFLYTVYWGLVMLVSALLVPAVLLPLHVAALPVIGFLVLTKRAPARTWLPFTAEPDESVEGRVSTVLLTASGIVVFAGWIMFAWW